MKDLKLNRIAESIVEEENLNEKFFEETVKSYNFSGFTRKENEGDVLWYYDKDETEDSFIVFGKTESGYYGYTVIVFGEEFQSVEKENCEDLFDVLKLKINKYVGEIEKHLAEIFNNEEQEIAGIGECTIQEIEDDGSFKKLNDAFSFMIDPKTVKYYKAEFKSDYDKKTFNKSLSSIKEQLSNNLSVIYKRGDNKILFCTINPSDLNYVKKTIGSYGWTVKG